MRNIRLRLQYEGTRYQGWQKQTSTDNTIQGKMETLLTKMCGEPIEISASGRTDAGVHALGQVANFHTEATMSAGLCVSFRRWYSLFHADRRHRGSDLLRHPGHAASHRVAEISQIHF